MNKRFITLIAIFFPIFLHAQNDVSVLSFGTADSEVHAVQVALRTAIEKAFGTFVSANTLILNDTLVSDEIATISRGNIKSFEVLSTNIHNNQVSVNVRAVVSIDNLISYAKSKGSSAEFAGGSYVNNLKLMQFRAKNTEDALKILCKQVKSLSKDMFDYEINIKDPIRIQSQAFCHAYKKYTPEQRYDHFTEKDFNFDTSVDGFLVPVNILTKSNITSSSIFNLVTSTLDALNISREERIKYENAGIACEGVFDPRFEEYWQHAWIIPVSKDVINKTLRTLNNYYALALLNYKIVLEGEDDQELIWENIHRDKNILNVRWYSKKENEIYSELAAAEPVLRDRVWLVPIMRENTTLRLVHISNYINYGYKSLLFYKDHKPLIIYDSFHIPETKIEHTPTKKEIKEIKKIKKANTNYIDVPKYDTIYGESRKVHEKLIYLYISKEQMALFKGVRIEK